MRLTYEALIADPKLLDAMLAEARRERALAFHRYLVAPIARLFGRAQLERPRLPGRTAYC